MGFTPIAFRPFMNKGSAAPDYGEFLTKDAQQYYNESAGAVAAQKKIIPATINAERDILGGLQQYQAERMGSQSRNLLGQYADMQGMANERQSEYQGQLLGMYGGAGGMATDYAIQGLGAGGQGVYNQFMQQANMGLGMGSQLSFEDQQASQQTARAAMAARGLTGNQAVGQEVLNSYQLGHQRMQERQQMGMQAMQMAQQQQQFGHQAYLSPSMQQSQSIYGLPSLYDNTQGSFQNMAPQFIQPESQYLANIRGNRISQENADKAAKAQNQAGIVGGVATVAAAYFI